MGGEKLQDRAEWDENKENPRNQGFQSCLGRWKDRGRGWSRRRADWGRAQSVWPYRGRGQVPTDESLDHSFLDVRQVSLLKEASFQTRPQNGPAKHKWGREEQPHLQGVAAARLQEDREELLHVQGQEGQPRGDTPCPR